MSATGLWASRSQAHARIAASFRSPFLGVRRRPRPRPALDVGSLVAGMGATPGPGRSMASPEVTGPPDRPRPGGPTSSGVPGAWRAGLPTGFDALLGGAAGPVRVHRDLGRR